MGLIRTAAVLAVGVALMPSDKAQQERLYDNAATAVHWTVTFCDRNERTCENAGTAWDVFVAKAQFAGQLAYDLAQRYAASGSEQTPAAVYAPAALKTEQGVADPRRRGTLTQSDLEPDWRGAPRRQGI